MGRKYEKCIYIIYIKHILIMCYVCNSEYYMCKMHSYVGIYILTVIKKWCNDVAFNKYN